MSKKDSLDLIEAVEEVLEVMKKSNEIKPVKVKSMLEHLRSSLEYLANDTYDFYQHTEESKRPKNINFPYGQKKFIDNFFKKTLHIPDPESSPLYAIFNSIQDFHTGENFLVMMCKLTNEVKHRKPISLKEEVVSTRVKISAKGLNLFTIDDTSTVTVSGLKLNDKPVSDFTYKNGKFESTSDGIPLNICITQDKKIKFHGNDYEVIPFLENSSQKIKKFINTAYDAIDSLR